MKISSTTIKKFQQTIWDFYSLNKRDFPWRQTTDPYHIFISEVMLQQTQTYRVLPKYEAWITKFPNFALLATAPFSEVLQYWSGLGYNRRALYLQNTAKRVMNEFGDTLPLDPEILETFSGIGKNTAGSIYVFSTNKPYVFIETNIRRVFIHFFFKDQENIHDKDILQLIKQTLDTKNPREWYYALMDYGNMLAKTENVNRKSKHYTKQSKFEGSIRQVRGTILKILLTEKIITIQELQKKITEDEKFEKALSQLEKEGFILIKENKISFNG